MFMLKKLSSHFTDRLIWKKYYLKKKICKKALLNILIKFRLIYHDQVQLMDYKLYLLTYQIFMNITIMVHYIF